MKRLIIVIVLALLIANGCTYSDSASHDYRGTVEATEIDVRAEISGQVLSVAVEEGSSIKQGDILAKIDDAGLKAKRMQQEAKLLQAKANLQKALAGARTEEIAAAEARVEKASAALNLARDIYEKTKKLFDAGAISEQSYLEAKTAKQAAEAEYNTANQGLALLKKGSRPEDIATAQGLVKEAEAALKEVSTYLDKATIKAPVDGEVSMRTIDVGDLVSTGYALFTITDMSDMWLTVYVPEDEIVDIGTGTKASVALTAFPDKKFNGEVIRVQQAPSFATRRSTDEQGEKDIISFDVKIKLINNEEKIIPGMTGYVTFEAGDS